MAIFRSIAERLRHGLAKTRQVMTMDLRDLVRGRQVDEGLIEEIKKRLLKADVGLVTTGRLVEGIRADAESGKLQRGDDVVDYLKRELAALWPEQDRSLHFAASGPTVIMVTGVNGAGKTTSIAKLCRLLRGQGKSVLLAACDTFRAGAVRQLEVWAERLGVEVVKGQ